MKELTEIQRKAQEYWPSYVDEFVNEKFPKRMRNYYKVLIGLSLAFTVIISAIDIFKSRIGSYLFFTPVYPILFLIIRCILYIIQLLKCDFDSSIKDENGITIKPMFPRTRMKQELRKKLTKFDRVFRTLCIVFGIVAYLLCWYGGTFLLVLDLPMPPQIFYSICYALIMAAVVAITYFPPKSSLYKPHCRTCDMCNSDTITDSKDEYLGLYSSGTAERTVADIYLGSKNVGSIKEKYSTGLEEKRRATHTHRCAFCGTTYTNQFTYWKKV